jgi:hypothetical protein
MNRRTFIKGVAATGVLAACAGKPQTVTTTTETIECAEPELNNEPGRKKCTEMRRETTVVTETEKGCHGVVSCSFGLVGSLVSLPFRIVGEVLDTVF